MLPKLLIPRAAGGQKDASCTHRVCGGGRCCLSTQFLFCGHISAHCLLGPALDVFLVFPTKLTDPEEEAWLSLHQRVPAGKVPYKCLTNKLMNQTPVLSVLQSPQPDPQNASFLPFGE